MMFVASLNADHYLYTLKLGFLPFASVGSFLFVLSDLCIHWVNFRNCHSSFRFADCGADCQYVYVDPENHLVDRLILPLYYTGQLLICQSAINLASLGL